MKVIALLPFKNEEWCLPAYLHNTKVIADEIIAIDDGSTDTSIRTLIKAGAKVHSSEKLKNYNSGWSEGLLSIICFTHLNSCNFCNCVGIICGF